MGNNRFLLWQNIFWLYQRGAIELCEAVEAKRGLLNVERADPIDLCYSKGLRSEGYIFKLQRLLDNRKNKPLYVSAETVTAELQRELDRRRDRNINVIKNARLSVNVVETAGCSDYKIAVQFYEV